MFAAWAERTPEDFVLTMKMSRFLTHIKRLAEPEEAVERFFDRAAPLGPKMGPILLQLPPRMEAAPDRLEQTLRAMRGVRVAVEFRHPSWYSEQVRRLLERYGAALTWADRRRPLGTLWRTAGWGFLRFHEGAASPRPCYGRRALGSWVERLRSSFSAHDDVYCYFNNDHRCCAVRDAIVFARAAGRAGFAVSRVPDPKAVSLSRTA